jgi:hypothetical protein
MEGWYDTKHTLLQVQWTAERSGWRLERFQYGSVGPERGLQGLSSRHIRIIAVCYVDDRRIEKTMEARPEMKLLTRSTSSCSNLLTPFLRLFLSPLRPAPVSLP